MREDGPLKLVVLIGHPGGRWCPEVSGKSAQSQAVRGMLASASGGELGERVDDSVSRVVGVAVVRGWRCVLGAASHADTHALMLASENEHKRRSGLRFIEHEVVVSATFCFTSELGSLSESLPVLLALPQQLLGRD